MRNDHIDDIEEEFEEIEGTTAGTAS